MTWLIPVTSPSDSLTRKIESLVALAGSIAPVKGNRDSRLHVETVELVQDVDVETVGGEDGAVRLG